MSKGKAEGMRLEWMDLATLVGAPRNPKAHDAGAIAASYRRFGYIEPMVVDERTGRLVAGHGRRDTLQAQKAAGQHPPRNVRVKAGQWLVPVLRGVEFETDADAEAYLVASNRTVELGGWEHADLANVLTDLAAQGGLAGVGYDTEDIDDLLRRLAGPQDGAGSKGQASEHVGLPESPVMVRQARQAAGLPAEGPEDAAKSWEEALAQIANLREAAK